MTDLTNDQKREIEQCEALLATGCSAADMRELGHADGAIREAIRRAIEADRIIFNER